MFSPEINHLFSDNFNLNCGRLPIHYLTYLDRKTDNGKPVIRLNTSALTNGQELLSCEYVKIEFGQSDFVVNSEIVRSESFEDNKTLEFPFEDEFARVSCQYMHKIRFGERTFNWTRRHNNMFQSKVKTVNTRTKSIVFENHYKTKRSYRAAVPYMTRILNNVKYVDDKEE